MSDGASRAAAFKAEVVVDFARRLPEIAKTRVVARVLTADTVVFPHTKS